MSGFGETPVSTTPLGANQFPAASVAVPNHANGDFTALEGGPESIDSNGNKSAPVAVHLKNAGVYNSVPPGLVSAQQSQLQLDIVGNVLTSLNTYISGEDSTVTSTNATGVMVTERRYKYTHITLAAPTTTLIFSGPGLLHRIEWGAVAGGVIKLYDDVFAGTLVRTFTSPATLLKTNENEELNILLNTGLCIVTSGAAQDILVAWRLN